MFEIDGQQLANVHFSKGTVVHTHRFHHQG
jgi:hypothetical protein